MKKNEMKKIIFAFSRIWFMIIFYLPDEFSRFRIRYYNKKGCCINNKVSISPNVRIIGLVSIDEGSSIAQNCSISGGNAGVFIGKNVMIAPNVSIVAFNHGYDDVETPMVNQKNTEATVVVEDNVWIASNCTIGKGVRIGTGSIIAANSFVNKDVPPYSIAGGVPVRVIKSRQI